MNCKTCNGTGIVMRTTYRHIDTGYGGYHEPDGVIEEDCPDCKSGGIKDEYTR